MSTNIRIVILFLLVLLSGQTYSNAFTTTFLYTYDADEYFYIDQNIKFEDQKTNYDGNPNFLKHVDDLQSSITEEKSQTRTIFAFVSESVVAKSGNTVIGKINFSVFYCFLCFLQGQILT